MNKKGGAYTVGHELIITADIQSRIYKICGVQVMNDMDMASLFCVETRVLNQAVKRNKDRFPEEFCFRLSAEEYDIIWSRIVTLKGGRGMQIMLQKIDTDQKTQTLSAQYGLAVGMEDHQGVNLFWDMATNMQNQPITRFWKKVNSI